MAVSSVVRHLQSGCKLERSVINSPAVFKSFFFSSEGFRTTTINLKVSSVLYLILYDFYISMKFHAISLQSTRSHNGCRNSKLINHKMLVNVFRDRATKLSLSSPRLRSLQ